MLPVFMAIVVVVAAHLHEDEYNSLSFVSHISDGVTEKQQIIDIRDDLLRFGDLLVTAETDLTDTSNLRSSVADLQLRRDHLCEKVSSTYHARSNAAHEIREKLNLNNHLANQGGRNTNNFLRAANKNAVELHSLEQQFDIYVTASRACDAILTAIQRFEIRLAELRSIVEEASEL
jgi:hypothetical protein